MPEMAATNKNGAFLREELEELYAEHGRMHFPPSTSDERIRKLHDILIMWTDDVSGAITEVLKGPRRLLRVRRYLGMRRNKRAEGLIRELSRAKLETDVEAVLEEYKKQYAHMIKMIEVASAVLKASASRD